MPASDVPSAVDTSSLTKEKETKLKLKTDPPAPKPDVMELPFSPKPDPDDHIQPKSKDGVQTVSSQVIGAADVSHSKRQRVKDAARGIVEENVRPRVEKLRHASSVVLEEAAAIDPSLRFVLIAVFLFIVFIALLALSFVR